MVHKQEATQLPRLTTTWIWEEFITLLLVIYFVINGGAYIKMSKFSNLVKLWVLQICGLITPT